MITAYKILLIDDDEDEFIILNDLLYEIQDKQYKIDWVKSADEALTALQNFEYDVGLVDYRLGAESGINLITQSTVLGITTPLILMTGQEQREVDETALQAGAADYLIKGRIDTSQIDRSIRYVVERARILKLLQDNQRRMILAFEAARTATWEWYMDTSPTMWSANIEGIIGLDLNEFPRNLEEYLGVNT